MYLNHKITAKDQKRNIPSRNSVKCLIPSLAKDLVIIYKFAKHNAPSDSLTHQSLNFLYSVNKYWDLEFVRYSVKHCKGLETYLSAALWGSYLQSMKNMIDVTIKTQCWGSSEKEANILLKHF